jgi:hypothetical protein
MGAAGVGVGVVIREDEEKVVKSAGDQSIRGD